MTITGDWTEGDALTPTNLSTKGGGNFPDRTYNAGWARFGTSSVAKETRIQAAITQAAVDGIPAVFVPASMLPYDASIVTFNLTVRMTCENGFPDHVDINAYGADRTIDSYAAIQAALNYAKASVTAGRGHASLRGRAETYFFRKPLIVPSGVVLDFLPQGFPADFAVPHTTFLGLQQGGPILQLCGPATATGLVPSLVSGPGQAYTISQNPGCWLNLRDFPTVELNGLTSFGVRGWYQGSGTAQGNIVGSRGRFNFGDTATQCFALLTESGTGNLQFSYTMSGSGASTITTTVNVNDGTIHYLECNITGGTARVFVDGTLAGSAAATGTLVQGVAEDVTVGPLLDMTPGQTLNISAANGVIDSLELGDTAWHTSNYTPPTTKHLISANTLILLNGLSVIGLCIQAETKNSSNGWLFQRVNSNTTATGSSSEIRYLALSGAGNCIGIAVGPQSYSWGAYGVSATNCRIGILAEQADSFGGTMEHIRVVSGGRYNIVSRSGAMRDVWLQGARVNLVCLLSHYLANVFVQCDLNAYIGAVLQNQSIAGGFQIFGMLVNTEPGVAADFAGAVSISGIANTLDGGIWISGGIETGNSKPHILMASSINNMTFQSVFFGSSGAAAVMSVVGTLASRSAVKFDRCHQVSWLPWSDVPGKAVVGPIGKSTAIATTSTQTFDASLRDQFESTLTANVSASTLINVTPGQSLSWLIKQDSTGSRLWTVPSAITYGQTLSIYTAANGWNFIDTEVGLDGNAYVRSFKTGP